MMAHAPFTLFPAIDLRAGKVVRLAQGDPARQRMYGNDPLAWAERWKAEGAEWLHVINLDGAFGQDARENMKALGKILPIGLKVEFGGGLRNMEDIRLALEIGVERACMGTAAIRDPKLVEWAVAAYGPAHISGDIGSREGKVVIKGWQEATPLSVVEAGMRFHGLGLEICVLTDVARDGVNAGVNIESAVELQNASGLKVVASGGVNKLEDIRKARQAGLAGVIIGRALYEGEFTLREALSA
jgi:phosphoribosylformimino-5-aminoimidazole carboxamide ribotide isomerase